MVGKSQREQDHDQRGRQREPGEGGQRPAVAVPGKADRHADLAAGGARQELAQRDQIGVRALAEPAPVGDEFLAEITQMRDRAAERGQAQAQKDHKQAPQAFTACAALQVACARRHGCPVGSKRWLLNGGAAGRRMAMKP
jgi:hypothetical protein